MNLWAELENITRSLEIIHEKEKRLVPESPLTKLTNIQNDLFGKGIGYPHVCYLIDIANKLDIDHKLTRDDFYAGHAMAHIMTVDKVLDTVISKIKELDKGE